MRILEILDSIRRSIEDNPSFYSEKVEEILSTALSEIPEDQRNHLIKEVQALLVPFVGKKGEEPKKLKRRKLTKRERLSKVKTDKEPEEKKKPRFKELEYPVKKWVDYYINHAKAPKHREHTRKMNMIIARIEDLMTAKFKVLSGLTFNYSSFSFEDFQYSVDNYRKAALDWAYKPRNKHHLLDENKRLISLEAFIFNPNNATRPSLFMYFLENPAELKHQSEYQELVQLIINKYRESLKITKVEFNEKDLDCFNKSATKLKEFKKDNGIEVKDAQLVAYLIDALNKRYKDDFYIASLASHTTFNTVLPNYMKKLNVTTSKTREEQRKKQREFFKNKNIVG